MTQFFIFRSFDGNGRRYVSPEDIIAVKADDNNLTQPDEKEQKQGKTAQKAPAAMVFIDDNGGGPHPVVRYKTKETEQDVKRILGGFFPRFESLDGRGGYFINKDRLCGISVDQNASCAVHLRTSGKAINEPVEEDEKTILEAINGG